MIDKKKVGTRIAAIRSRLGYSQAKFAEYLGVSTQAVSKWETGLSLPDIEVLLSISWMAKTSINAILDESEFIDCAAGLDRGLTRINNLFVCQECMEPLTDIGKNGKSSFECRSGHRYEVIDGVMFFHTREIPGELWSLWLKNYEQYLENQRNPGLPRYSEGEVFYKEVMWRAIEDIRPKTIVDFACGMGYGIKYVIERIRWPITIIMADLSHRILKYDRMFFTEEWHNPYVDMVYLACDCANIPLRENSVDMVFSNAGFESMQVRMIDGFHEAHRILKPGGHTVFTVNVVDDYECENTKRWLKLYSSLEEEFLMENVRDIRQWIECCESTGYRQNKATKIYGEMLAPDGDAFPFENNLIRWMAQYVMVSQK